MNKNSSLIGIILARGGSKRIPQKNVRKLGGKPLICWTIESALLSGVFSSVIVSTDDEEIAKISIESGAIVPWLRPVHLSSDNTPSIEPVIHTLKWLESRNEKPNGILLLQPTLPFRKIETIIKSVKLFNDNNFRSVVSFSYVDFTPEWCMRENGNQIIPILGWESIKKKSQDIKPVLQINGLIYLATSEFVLEKKSFFDNKTIPLITEDLEESLDIDTLEDWNLAERHIMKIKNNKKKKL